jgi:hypothetical protein
MTFASAEGVGHASIMATMTAEDEVCPPDVLRKEAAARRADELRELIVRLTARIPARQRDAVVAAHHAAEARIRARQAHLAAAHRHWRSAEAHDRAAQAHREAAAAGVGDVAAHLEAVERHQAASDCDYLAGDVALRMAETE